MIYFAKTWRDRIHENIPIKSNFAPGPFRENVECKYWKEAQRVAWNLNEKNSKLHIPSRKYGRVDETTAKQWILLKTKIKKKKYRKTIENIDDFTNPHNFLVTLCRIIEQRWRSAVRSA